MTTLDARHDLRLTTPGIPHEHAWCVESSHAISTGQVLYVRCHQCGTRRVDLQDHADAPPTALSRELRSRPGGSVSSLRT